MINPAALNVSGILRRTFPHELRPELDPDHAKYLLRTAKTVRRILQKVMRHEEDTPLYDFFSALDATLELEQHHGEQLLAALNKGDQARAEAEAREWEAISSLALPLSYWDFTLKGVSKGRRASA